VKQDESTHQLQRPKAFRANGMQIPKFQTEKNIPFISLALRRDQR